MNEAPIPGRTSSQEEMIVVTKAYELARELTRRVMQYPRSHRFVLGDRTLGAAYDLLDILIEAKYRREKIALLDRANLILERIRFQWRLAHEEKLVSAGGWAMLAAQVDEVGRLIGGWRRCSRPPER